METLKKHKSIVLIITYTVFLVYTVFNFDRIRGFISFFLEMLSPVIYGLVFAFLVGLIVRSLYPFIRRIISKERSAYITSVVFAYLIFLGLIVGFLFLIIPQLNKSLQDIARKLPYFYSEFQNLVKDISIKLDLSSEQLAQIEKYLTDMYNTAYIFISNKLPDIISYAFNFVNFIKNLGFGLVISVYILLTKDKLAVQSKKTITVILPEKFALKTLDTASKANKIFRQYISAQVIVSLILGVVCFISMTIFKMPYALLVSIIFGTTNLIPIIGPIVGAIPATLIVMIDDPMTGIWFLILDIVLQQLEANIISPKIVGDSVGMSGLWVMVAIILGGGLFGLFGMIIAVPTMGVIYYLIGEYINDHYDSKFDEYVKMRRSKLKK